MRDTHKAETGEHALGRVVAVGHDDETGEDAVRCDDAPRLGVFFGRAERRRRRDETRSDARRERESEQRERMNKSHYGNNMSFCVSTGMIILR